MSTVTRKNKTERRQNYEVAHASQIRNTSTNLPKAPAVDPDALTALADDANRCHAKVIDSCKTALVNAKQAGEALMKAKQQVVHGQFMDWVGDHFDGSHETANIYMRLAGVWNESLEDVFIKNPTLSIHQAIQSLRSFSNRKTDKFAPISYSQNKTADKETNLEIIDRTRSFLKTLISKKITETLNAQDAWDISNHLWDLAVERYDEDQPGFRVMVFCFKENHPFDTTGEVIPKKEGPLDCLRRNWLNASPLDRLKFSKWVERQSKYGRPTTTLSRRRSGRRGKEQGTESN